MKSISGSDILAFGEALSALKRLGEMLDPKRMEAVVKAGCTAAEVHLACSYPECKCTQIPTAVKAAIRAWETPAAKIIEFPPTAQDQQIGDGGLK